MPPLPIAALSPSSCNAYAYRASPAKHSFVLMTAPLLLLASCQNPLPTGTADIKALACTCHDDRTVHATYPDNNTAVVTRDRATHRRNITVFTDGSRYIGDHSQWWTRGMGEGWLAALKLEELLSSSGVECHTP